MAAPRIIIADTDYNYIIPLQTKFINEFYNKIDLEIITEKNYFNEVFASPQKAEILIVSEDMYDPLLKRHDIDSIFLLTEQFEEDLTGQLGVNRILKYTSINEIFHSVMGNSADVLNIDAKSKREPQIVTVCSASGGVGKTTIALGICGRLTHEYKKVLYINAERMHTFQHRFENIAAVSDKMVYALLADESIDISFEDIKHVIRKELFHYLPPFKASLMSLGLNYSVYEKIAKAAKRSHEYDYIIIDADTVFDEEKAHLLDVSDKVLIVTDQTKNAVFATDVLVSNINGVDSEKFSFICNDFEKDEDNALIFPETRVRYTVNDYVAHFDRYEQMDNEDLAKNVDIQRVSVLVM